MSFSRVRPTRPSHGAHGHDHGKVDFALSPPATGDDQVFTAVAPHPTAEQLFAGAWSACYITAIGVVAAQKKVTLPADLSVDIDVDLGQTGAAWFLEARFDVRMPGLAHDVAERSRMRRTRSARTRRPTHGNIDVAVNVTTS